jgi:hypothetical protein
MRRLLAAAFALAIACERPADLRHTKRFDEQGLAFDYPGNWRVSSHRQPVKSASMRTITIESPGHAFVILNEFTPALDVSLENFAKRTIEGMQREIKKKSLRLFEMPPPTREPTGHQLLGRSQGGVRYRFTIEAPNAKVPHTADGFSVKGIDRTILVWMQSPDKDRAQAAPGFDRILDSLLLH